MKWRGVVLLLTATLLGAIEVGSWSAEGCSPERLTSLTAAAVVRVSVEQRDAKWVGAVETGGGRRKTFEAADCDALLDAMAVGVKLASVAPSVPVRTTRASVRTERVERVEVPARAVHTAVRSAARTERAERVEASATPAIPEPRIVVAQAEPLPAPPPPPPPLAVSAPVELPPARPPEPIHFLLAARGAIVLAPAPAPALGGEVSFGVLPGLGSAIELSVLYARTVELDLGPAWGRFSLTAGRLTGCSPALGLWRFQLSACGAFAAGAVWAQGVATGAVTTGYEVWLPWVDLSAAGRLAVSLPRGLQLLAQAGPTFPLSRHTFVFERPQVAVHQVGVVGFEGKLGLGWAW
jgi:hypothetical protein